MDEVAAEHVGADCIVHYGRACLSPSKRLPLMYIFEKRQLDVEMCACSFRELYPDKQSHVVLLYDVNYDHAIGKISHKTPKRPTPIKILRVFVAFSKKIKLNNAVGKTL